MEVYLLIALYLIVLLYSIILHEISHGIVALWLGDRTAKDSGRITLDPLPHIDLMGSIILPLIMIITTPFAFGWAKPVPYNPLNLIWQKWGPVCVAFAGPITNFILAGIAAMIGAFIGIPSSLKAQIISELPKKFMEGEMVALVAGDLGAIFFLITVMCVFWNVLLGIFNLIPLPPLDGSKLLFTLAPIKMETQIFLEKWGFIIVFGLIFLTPLGVLFSTVVQKVLNIFFGLML